MQEDDQPTTSEQRHAFFEAGHAIVGWLEGLEIVSVRLDEGGASRIDVVYPRLEDPRGKDRGATTSVIRALLAGPAALGFFRFGPWVSPNDAAGNQFDMNQPVVWQAEGLARRIDGDDSRTVLPGIWLETQALLCTPRIWAAVEAVATGLMLNHELMGSEVSDLASHAMRIFEPPEGLGVMRDTPR